MMKKALPHFIFNCLAYSWLSPEDKFSSFVSSTVNRTLSTTASHSSVVLVAELHIIILRERMKLQHNLYAVAQLLVVCVCGALANFFSVAKRTTIWMEKDFNKGIRSGFVCATTTSPYCITCRRILIAGITSVLQSRVGTTDETIARFYCQMFVLLFTKCVHNNRQFGFYFSSFWLKVCWRRHLPDFKCKIAY